MKYTKTISISYVFILFINISCSTVSVQNSDETINTFEQEIDEPIIQPEPGYNFFNQRPEIDSTYNLTHNKEDFANNYMNIQMAPIYYCTGTILNNSDTFTIMMNENTDSTCMIELFKLNMNNWQRAGTIEFPYNQYTFNDFKVEIDDYNFDGTKDIFIRTLVTMGIVFDYGHLFIISKTDLSIKEYVFEERIGNIRTNPKTKELIGEKLFWCGEEADIASATSQNIYFKWKDNEFVLSRVENPCE